MDELVRNAMKKRLWKWGSLFDKFEQTSLDTDGLSDDEGSEIIVKDPQFQHISAEHTALRKSLCSELGIPEEDLLNNSNSKEDTSPEFAIPKQKVSSKSLVGRLSNSSFNEKITVDSGLKVDNEPYGEISLRKQELSDGSNHTSIGEVHPGSLLMPKGSANVKAASISKRQKKVSCSSVEKRRLLQKQHHCTDIVQSSSQVDATPKKIHSKKTQSFLNKDKETIVKQYELWKRSQRIASGQFGYLYIVSSLAEKPSEENRFIPKVPAVVQKPKLVGYRRFSLKR